MPPSIFNPAEQDSIDRKIAVGLERISQALKSAIWEESKASGLSPIQIQFLVALYFEKNVEWTIGELATRFGLTPATVSDAVKILVGRGFVARSNGQNDKRSVILHLNASGKRAAAKISLWANTLQDSVTRLSEEEKPAFLKSILHIIQYLNEMGHIRFAAMCFTCRYFHQNLHKTFRKTHHCSYHNIALSDAELRVDCSEYEINETEQFVP